jgi:hypothetical protein
LHCVRRVQLNDAGQVGLKLKTPWGDCTTQLVMSPLEFMQQLAALVPRRAGVPLSRLRASPERLLRGAQFRRLTVASGSLRDHRPATRELRLGIAALGLECRLAVGSTLGKTPTLERAPARLPRATGAAQRGVLR